MGINESGNVFVRLSFGVFLPLFSAAITPPLTQRNELNQLIQVQRYFGLCTGKQGRAVPVLIKIFPVSWMPRGIFPKNLVFPKALPFDAHEISRINSLMHKKNVVIMKTAREYITEIRSETICRCINGWAGRFGSSFRFSAGVCTVAIF